jgi:pectin methylesterase-like acyl-CoA thioesterase
MPIAPARSLSALLLSLAAASTAFAQPTPPVRLLPASGAQAVCADTLLTLAFDRPPTLGASGQVRIYNAADDSLVDTLDLAIPLNQQTYTLEGVSFHAYPVLITGNNATIHPHKPLDYGKKYYVQIDPGLLTIADAPFPGIPGKQAWAFSTKPAPPAIRDRVVIAADGTADFATLQGALDALPADHPARITLFLRKGTYQEIISMVGKKDLTLLGEDREHTILTYPNNEKVQLGQGSSSKRGVVNGLRSTGIALANMTIRSGTPKGTGGGWQAEAVIFKSNSQVMLSDVSLYSFQDTLQMSSPGYVQNAYIQGDVDFMWGTGPCFFRDSRFVAVNNNDAFVVSRNNATTHGFIYLNCRFETAPGITGSILANNQNYPNSEVVLLKCALSPQINPSAWRGRGPSVHYWEFNSISTADNSPADVSARADGSRRLTRDADAQTIADYSNPAFVLGFTPALAPLIARQSVATPSAGATLLTVAAVAIPAPTYQWLKNGTPVPNATTPELKLPPGDKPADYSVTISNPSGAITSSPATPTP